MNEVENKLTELLSTIPPLLDEAGELLANKVFTSESLNRVALKLAYDCFLEYSDATEDNVEVAAELSKLDENGDVIVEKMHLFYLFDSLKLLLRHGMNPNDVVENESLCNNIMTAVRYIGYKNAAAECLRLLLEFGGDPNLDADNDGETLFIDADADMCTDIELDLCDGKEYPLHDIIQCWMVLLAFGGRLTDDRTPADMLNGHRYEEFKEFERYRWEVEYRNPTSDKTDTWLLHFYDIENGDEIAVV